MERFGRPADLGHAMDLAYVGTGGQGIPYVENLNLLPPSTTPYSAERSPYQRYNAVSLTQSGGSSIYNGLSLQADRRMAKPGLYFNANYTFAKALTDAELRSLSAGAQQNQYARYLERADDPNIRRHQLRFSYTYELPFGRGKMFLSKLPKERVFRAAGSSRASPRCRPARASAQRSPAPIRPTPIRSGTPGPDRRRQLRLRDMHDQIKAHQAIFDKSLSRVPAAGRGLYGNAARNILTGPGKMIWNTVMAKNLLLDERTRFQFRWEAFNAFNHANFNDPNTNISSSSFGLVTSAAPAVECCSASGSNTDPLYTAGGAITAARSLF